MNWDRTEWYLFILAALSMALIYYVAFVNIENSSFTGLRNIVYAVTGRNAAGQFQAPFK